jgi:Tfp pilus assembly PilM family ATPase
MIASLDLNRDHIIDFVILDENTEAHKTHLRVLGIAIAQKALESYIQLCATSNLRPEVVETATTSIIRLVDKSKIAEDGQPIIVADVENDVLKLFLFENKKYILLRTTKLLHLGAETKEDIVGNVEDDINKMLQFQFTRESRVGVQKIFFFGTNPLLSEIERAVNINLAIDTTMYPKPDFLSGREESYLPFLYPIGAALRK